MKKSVLNYRVTKTTGVFLLVFIIQVLLVNTGYAQDLSDFQDGVEENASILKGIFQIVLGLILAGGVIGVVYAYIFNNQRAKENLIGFIIAIIVGTVGEVWLAA